MSGPNVMDKIFDLHKDFKKEHGTIIYRELISVLKEKEVHDLLEKRVKVAVEEREAASKEREEKLRQLRKAREKKRNYNLKRYTAMRTHYNKYKKNMEEFRQTNFLSFKEFNDLKKKDPEQIIATERLLEEYREIAYAEKRDRTTIIPSYLEFVASKK